MFGKDFLKRVVEGAATFDPDWDFPSEVAEGERELGVLSDETMALFRVSHELTDDYNRRVNELQQLERERRLPEDVAQMCEALEAERRALNGLSEIIWSIARTECDSTGETDLGIRRGKKLVAIPEKEERQPGFVVEVITGPPSLGDLMSLLASRRRPTH